MAIDRVQVVALTDRSGVYQYKAFGVPGLGLKRGLSDELVVAPYATALASLVDPASAASNFRRLARIGLDGRFGFREAIDFRPRLPPAGIASTEADRRPAGSPSIALDLADGVEVEVDAATEDDVEVALGDVRPGVADLVRLPTALDGALDLAR